MPEAWLRCGLSRITTKVCHPGGVVVAKLSGVCSRFSNDFFFGIFLHSCALTLRFNLIFLAFELSLSTNCFNGGSLRVHVHSMIRWVVNAELLVKVDGPVTLHFGEKGILVPVNALEVVFGHGVLNDLHVVSDDVGFSPEMLSVKAPSDLTGNPNSLPLRRSLVIKSFLLGVHLLAQVPRIRWLVDSRCRVLQSFLKPLLQSTLSFVWQ